MSKSEADKEQKQKNGSNGRTGPIASEKTSGGFFSSILKLSRMVGAGGPALALAGITLVVVFGVFLFSLVPQQIRLRAGDVSPVNVKAPQEVIDDAATNRLKAEVAATVAEVWEGDKSVLTDIKSEIGKLKETINSLASSPDTSTQEVLAKVRPFLDPDIADADILGVVAASSKSIDEAFLKLTTVLDDILGVGLKPDNLQKGREQAYAALAGDPEVSPEMERFLASFVAKNLKPNLIFNRVETEKRIKEAMDALEPVRIRRGQFIVREGDIVTEDQIAILRKLGMVGSRVKSSMVAGAALMSLAFTGFMAVYLRVFYQDIMTSRKASLAFALIVLSVVSVKGLTQISGFLVPTSLGVMLSTTLFDRRFGILLGTCLSLVVGVVTGFDVRFVILSLAGGLAAAAAIRSEWSRSHLLRAGLLVSLVEGGVYLGLGLVGVIPMSDIVASWRDPVYVLMAGPLCSILAIGVLPVFESVFGIITPIRLIELSNPEHPLLHRLLLEAPGTYHHSIMVGNLAEAACWAIGADSLLARVGAYYHDIGKVKRPYFFAENQVAGVENPHDKMNPALSSTVIMAHVKDGLELAKEHKVPEVIQDFIAEHHGTTLVSYFFTRASENQKDRLPEEWDYRYEGPRPGSKETAIVMLADSIEAATRSLAKPTPARLESVVRKIISERLSDHQLDRSDLTLKELDIVADTFTRVLSGIFHTRIEYPERPAK